MSQRLIVYGMRVVAVLIVGALGGFALYISYLHMVELAHRSGVRGVTAVAFPLTVDGLEIIAAVVLVYDRYAGRRAGLLPWTVLTVGATMSVAANAAVAPDNPIARGIYATSAICLIAAVKLLTHLLQPLPSRPGGDTTPQASGDTGTAVARPEASGDTPPTAAAAPAASVNAPAQPDTSGDTIRDTTGDTPLNGAVVTPPAIVDRGNAARDGDTAKVVVPVAGHQRRRVVGGIERRVPTTAPARQRWRDIWQSTRDRRVATEADAAAHAVSKRTLQSIHAAGRAGLLDPIPPQHGPEAVDAEHR